MIVRYASFRRYISGLVFIPFYIVHAYALWYFRDELLPGHWKLFGVHSLAAIFPIMYLFFEKNTNLNRAIGEELLKAWCFLKGVWIWILPIALFLLGIHVFIIESSLLAQSERGMWFVEKFAVPLIHVPIDNIFQLRLNFFLNEWIAFDYVQFVSSYFIVVIFAIFLLYSRGQSIPFVWVAVSILAMANFVVVKENLYCHTKINTAIISVMAYFYAAKSKYAIALFLIAWSCIIGLAGVIYTLPLILLMGYDFYKGREALSWGNIYVLISAGLVSFFSIWGTFYYVLQTRGGPEYLIDNVEAGSNIFLLSTATHLLEDLWVRFPLLSSLTLIGVMTSAIIDRAWLKRFAILFVIWFFIRSTIDLSGYYYSLELIPFMAFFSYHGMCKCFELPYFSRSLFIKHLLLGIVLILAVAQFFLSYGVWENSYLNRQSSSLKHLLEENDWLPVGSKVFFREAVLSPYLLRSGRSDLNYQSYPGKKEIFMETVAGESNALIFGPVNDFGISDRDLESIGYQKVPGFYDNNKRWRMFYKTER